MYKKMLQDTQFNKGTDNFGTFVLVKELRKSQQNLRAHLRDSNNVALLLFRVALLPAGGRAQVC